MYQDDCRLKGVVNLVLRDKNGKVKQHKTVRNKVTRYGIAHIIGRMVDDDMDRAGTHRMPRMMSHMGIGIGAAARAGVHRYNAQDLNNPTNQTTPKPRKHAAEPKSYDRMLQDERGIRVQLMKDTTLASDYEILRNAKFTKDTGAGVNIITTSGGKTQIVFETGSDGNNTIERLRVGLKLLGIRVGSGTDEATAPSSTATTTYIGGGAFTGTFKIASITSGTPSSTATTIVLDGVLPTSAGSNEGIYDPSGSGAGGDGADGNLYIDFEYVNQKSLTTYKGSDGSGASMHPTHENVKAMNITTTGGVYGPFTNSNAKGDLFHATNNPEFGELGLGNLGVLRGQIGAFYEREVNSSVDLINVASNTTDHSYAKLDGSGATAVARFPFIGSAEDKPTGQAASSAANTVGTRATEFVQFGTAVDGIFQGEIPAGGSSLIEDIGVAQEGYPANEHDYGADNGQAYSASAFRNIGGFTLSGTGADTVGTYHATTAGSPALVVTHLKFHSTNSYGPNARRGAKKHGDRVIYVATFKENNPRPEADRDFFNDGSAGPNNLANRSPTDRIYPITEAGIFNKHKADIGVFDVGDRDFDYTGNTSGGAAAGSDPTKLAHIDRRGSNATGYKAASTDDVGNNTLVTSHTTGDIPVSASGKAIALQHGEVTDVLTSGAEKVKASAFGFTQGQVTQSMLCRTTFDPVNKATADTLQITWSVQLQDQ